MCKIGLQKHYTTYTSKSLRYIVHLWYLTEQFRYNCNIVKPETTLCYIYEDRVGDKTYTASNAPQTHIGKRENNSKTVKSNKKCLRMEMYYKLKHTRSNILKFVYRKLIHVIK